MSEGEIFMRLLLSGVMLAGGARESWRGNYSIGIFMIMVPVAAWFAWWFGRP